MFKRKLAVMTALLTTISCITVQAGTFTSDGTTTIPVIAATTTATGGYEVSIPAVLPLTYDEGTEKFKGTYSIGAKGGLALDEGVYIRPGSYNSTTKKASFSMKGSKTGDVVSASLTQSKAVWGTGGDSTIAVDDYTNASGTVEVALDKADVYTGGVEFSFGTEFRPAAGTTSYKGAEILALLEKYAGKTDFYIKVVNPSDTTYYIGDGNGNKLESAAEAALIAKAKNEAENAYIEPLGNYTLAIESTATAGYYSGVSFTKN